MAAPKDAYSLLHHNMVRAHHTLKLGFNSILTHLTEDTIIKDLDNFIGYCLAWTISVIGHHESEEAIVFPFLNQKMDFASEKEAHEVIFKGITALEILLKEFKADHAKFDPSQIKKSLEEMKEPLFAHLDAEVEHIKADELKKAGFSEAELKDMDARLDKYVKNHGDPFIIVPYMMSHNPPEIQAVWPSMPWLLRKLVIPYVLAKRHSGYWKYSPYTL